MLCVTAMLHLKPVYTPLVLRDWSGAAPGTRLYRFSSRSGLTAIFFFFIPARYPVNLSSALPLTVGKPGLVFLPEP